MTNAFELIDPSVAAVWSLIHFFWQGAGLALVLAAALKISQRNSSDVRYLLCCAAMAGMALCPVLTLCSFELSGSGRSSFDRTESTLPDAAAAHGGQRSAAENGSRAMIDWTDRHMTVILSLWCAGVLIGLARLFVSLAAVRRLDSSSVGAAPNQLQSRADQVGLRLKLRGSVRLVVSGQVTAPVVAGWRKPIVIVPTSLLSGLSPQEEDSILAHELAHIRRRDYLVNVIQTALEGVLFYHPAVWWVSKQIRRERETQSRRARREAQSLESGPRRVDEVSQRLFRVRRDVGRHDVQSLRQEQRRPARANDARSDDGDLANGSRGIGHACCSS